jgi:hypothetical protein
VGREELDLSHFSIREASRIQASWLEAHRQTLIDTLAETSDAMQLLSTRYVAEPSRETIAGNLKAAATRLLLYKMADMENRVPMLLRDMVEQIRRTQPYQGLPE